MQVLHPAIQVEAAQFSAAVVITAIEHEAGFGYLNCPQEFNYVVGNDAQIVCVRPNGDFPAAVEARRRRCTNATSAAAWPLIRKGKA